VRGAARRQPEGPVVTPHSLNSPRIQATFPHVTLRAKFTLGALLLTELVLAVCLVLAALLWRQHALAGQRAAQREAVQRFAQVCRDSFQERNDLLALNYMKVAASGPEVRYLALTDTSNKLRVHSDLLKGDPAALAKPWPIPEDPQRLGLRVEPRADLGDRVDYWSIPVLLEKRWLGTAHIGYDRGVLERTLQSDFRRAARHFAMVGLLLSLTAVVGAFLLAWHVNRPIQDLAEATRRMGEGDLEHRIRPSTRDELGGLTASFNAMAVQLERLQELREQTMSSVTHDLQAPLAAILSYAQLLREQAAERLREEDAHCIEAIVSGVKRLTIMTQDILDLAKLKAGRLILRKSPSEVPELVRESLRVMEGAAQGLQVRLESEVEPGLPPVMVDPTLIVRVLVNLVANSLRFTPEDGRVLVGAGPRDGSVEITVMDTGVGIPPQHIGSLFTRFTQVPDTMGASRQGMGTGLGLAICKEIVNAHGGSISATSKVGEGTTVRFTLPIR